VQSSFTRDTTGGSGPQAPFLSEAKGWSIAMRGQAYINATSTVERGFLEVRACQFARMLLDVGLKIAAVQRLTS
jgi:hypothetical protein